MSSQAKLILIIVLVCGIPACSTLTGTGAATPNAPHVVGSLAEFESSRFCQTYNCHRGESWSLRRGGTNHEYDTSLNEVDVAVTTLDGKPVDAGLGFYDRDVLATADLQAISLFLNAIQPGVEVDTAIANYVQQNSAVRLNQICEAIPAKFGLVRIWAGHVGAVLIVSIGESCNS